ncbi:MAG: hypothetical protein M1818_007731 [Claussenomyces sp. TS43310]|nr:MAG: hypothetical protein M1818_007731 [Claussenomyces sp. TS43310]
MSASSLLYFGALALFSTTASAACATDTSTYYHFKLGTGSYVGNFDPNSQLETTTSTTPADLGNFKYVVSGESSTDTGYAGITTTFHYYRTSLTPPEEDKMFLATSTQPQTDVAYGHVHVDLPGNTEGSTDTYIVGVVNSDCTISFTAGANPASGTNGANQYDAPGTALTAYDCAGVTGSNDPANFRLIDATKGSIAAPQNCVLTTVTLEAAAADGGIPSTTTSTPSTTSSSSAASSSSTTSATSDATTSTTSDTMTTGLSTSATLPASDTTAPASTTSTTSTTPDTTAPDSTTSVAFTTSDTTTGTVGDIFTTSIATTGSAISASSTIGGSPSTTETSASGPIYTGGVPFNVEVLVGGTTYYGAESIDGAFSLTTSQSAAALFTYNSGSDQLEYIEPGTSATEYPYVPLNLGESNPIMYTPAVNASSERDVDAVLSSVDGSLVLSVPTYPTSDWELEVCDGALWTIATDDVRDDCAVVDHVYAVPAYVSSPSSFSGSVSSSYSTGFSSVVTARSTTTVSVSSVGTGSATTGGYTNSGSSASTATTVSEAYVSATSSTPGTTGLPPSGTFEFIGCVAQASAIFFEELASDVEMTVERCLEQALEGDFRYAGLHVESCIAGNFYNGTFNATLTGDCNIPCPGNPSEDCGGNLVVPMVRKRQADITVPLISLYEFSVDIGISGSPTLPAGAGITPAPTASTYIGGNSGSDNGSGNNSGNTSDVGNDDDNDNGSDNGDNDNSGNTVDSGNTNYGDVAYGDTTYGNTNNYYAGQVYTLPLTQTYIGKCGCADVLRTMTYTEACTFTACGCSTQSLVETIPMTTSTVYCPSCGPSGAGQTVTLTVPCGAPTVGAQQPEFLGAAITPGTTGIPLAIANAAGVSGALASGGSASNAVGAPMSPSSPIPYATTNNADKLLGSVFAVVAVIFAGALVIL